jgi:hypothetical protein
MMLNILRALAPAVLAVSALPAAEPLPAAILQREYAHPLHSPGAPGCLFNQPVWRILSGALPAGLRLDSSGRLAGLPTSPGLFRFTTLDQTLCGGAVRDWTLAVRGAPILAAEPREIELTSGETAFLTVDASWRDLPYSARSASPWLRLRPERGRTPPEGSVLAGDRVAVLASQAGEAEIVLSAWGAAEAVRIRVRAR